MMSNSMTEVAPVAAPAAAATASPPGGAVHPLSFAQQRLWFIDRIDGASTQYNLPLAIRLCGTLDRPSLQAAFDRLMARHSVLRTSFHVIDGVVRQHVGAPAPFVLEERDVSGAPAQQDVIDAAVCEEIERTFDLARDPMMRATLLRLTGPGQPAEHILLITLHHIAADGWSLRLLVQEFVRLYLASLQGLDDPLAPLTMDYAQYAAWQRQRLSPTYLADQLAYWRRQLEGIALVHALPLDRPRPPQPLSDAGRYLQPIGSSLHQQLQALAKRHRASLFMVLQSMFAVVLGRRSGEDDIAVGVPVAGRTHQELEPLLGLFVNTLVLRSRLGPDLSLEQVLQQGRETALAAFEHQDVPFEMLLDELKPARSLSHAPLFQVLFSLENQAPGAVALPGLTIDVQPSSRWKVKCDLEVEVSASDAGLQISWLYASSLFDAATIERMGADYLLVLEALVADPQQLLAQLPPMPAMEWALIEQWNDTGVSFAQDDTIASMFETQVARSAGLPALRWGDAQLSYGALNERANQLAHYLIAEHGIGRGQLVGLCMERSPEMVVGLLAILKAGGAYVPLEPSHPPQRLAYMLGDSAARVVLTQPHLLDVLGECAAARVVLDDATSAGAMPFADYGSANPVRRCGADDLAYAIYTSGSTGQPKGTLNRHRGVCNRLHTMQRQFPLTPDDRLLQKTPLSFDVSVWELFWPLSVGSVLVLAAPDGHKDPGYLARTVLKAQ